MNLQQQNINVLIAEIKDKLGRPVSVRVVMATIESLGVRNKDTQEDYGVSSIEKLAAIIYKNLCSISFSNLKNLKEREALLNGNEDTIFMSNYLRIKAKLFSKYYPKGILHLLPVFVQIYAIVLFGYSLWTYVGFNQLQSTAVVLGVILGMITTGGFVQVIGKQASFYWNYGDFNMMKKTIDYLLKVGVISIFLLFTLLFILNSFINFYPYQVLLIVFVYAFLIGLLLLILAPLHTIEQRWVISVAVLIGTFLAIFLKFNTSLNIYYTHWIGIGVTVIISQVFLHFYFNKKIDHNKDSDKIGPKITAIIYQNYQYFFYGIFIYVFIFTDRILAWSSNINGELPFVIYYEKDYEIGMDLAILVFLLLAGVLEYSVAAFTRFLNIGQKGTAHSNPKDFGKKLFKMYWHHVGLLLLTSAFIFLLIYYIVTGAWGYEAQFEESLKHLSIRVCIIGGIGYLLLAWGMLNTLYLFTLNQPTKALRAIVLACIVNLIIGMIMSRFVAYELSVVGMLCGALLFLGLTLKESIHFYKNLDYYYYASF